MHLHLAGRTVRLAAVGLAGSLALSGCLVRGGEVGQGPSDPAGTILRNDATTQGWENFVMLREEQFEDRSAAMGVYFETMEFEPGNVSRAECSAAQFVNSGPDGQSGGAGTCSQVGRIAADPDWSWSTDDPNRIFGSVAIEATEVEVRYANGDTERLTPLRPPGPFSRSYLFHVLFHPVANVEEITVVATAG